MVPAVVLALLVGLPLAFLSWWRFRYRVAGGRLELHSGVLSRSVRTIPLERVRGIRVTEPFLHRLLGLVRVDVEAAAGGGESAELSLPAVSRAQADELREAPWPRARAPGRRPPGAAALPGDRGPPRRRRHHEPELPPGPGGDRRRRLNLADDLPGGYIEQAAEAAAERFPPTPSGSPS